MAERIRTNAEIDVLNQFLEEGKTPLPYEVQEQSPETIVAPIETKVIEIELTPEQKAEQEKLELDRIAAQKIIDDNKKELEKLNDAEKKKVIASVEEKEKVPDVIIPQVELNDEAVLAYLKKSKGKDISSLDEFINPPKILTDEEKRYASEKRESNMFAFGLSKGEFTKKDLENFISDTKNPTEVVYTAYANDQKKKDETLTDKDIREEFEEKFGLNIEDKDNRHYIAGQNLINKIADGIIKSSYPKIVNIDKEYTSFESTQKSTEDQKKKLATQTPIYKRDIEDIKNSSKKIIIPINDKESFEFIVDDSVLDEVAQEMLSENIIKENINKGYKKENLKQLSDLTALMKSLPKLMNDYSDKKELERQAGLRGVKPSGKETGRERVVKELSEDQKRALTLIDERLSLAN